MRSKSNRVFRGALYLETLLVVPPPLCPPYNTGRIAHIRVEDSAPSPAQLDISVFCTDGIVSDYSILP